MKVASSVNLGIAETECSITILDLLPQDSGLWMCHVKNDLRSNVFSEAFVNIDIAAPYALSVEIPNKVNFIKLADKPLNNISREDDSQLVQQDRETSQNEIGQYASCSASSMGNLGGGVDPQLLWFVNGKQVQNTESHILQHTVSKTFRVYLSPL